MLRQQQCERHTSEIVGSTVTLAQVSTVRLQEVLVAESEVMAFSLTQKPSNADGLEGDCVVRIQSRSQNP